MKLVPVADDRPICPCEICDRRRRLQLTLAEAGDVVAGRRLFVLGLDCNLFQNDADELKEMIADLNETVQELDCPDHHSQAKERLDLESNLAKARYALVRRRRTDAGLDERLVQDDTRDLKEMIADVNEAVKKLDGFDRRFQMQRRRELKSELAEARDVLARRRRCDTGLEERVVQDDPRDLKKLIANVNKAVEKLNRLSHHLRPRRRRRSVGRFMARARPWARPLVEPTDPRDRESTWQL